jgi:hypothetical protein
MSRRSALRKALPLVAIVASGAVLVPAAQNAGAQQPNNGAASGQPPRVLVVPRGEPVIGGYSLRLSDIWGPAKMPPAPKDFGPHFDFPPAPLNSVPLPDPYPH